MPEHAYQIIVCPKCREQIDPEYGYCEHDSITYDGVTVEARAVNAAAKLTAAALNDEAKHRLAEEQRAADRAEIARMEAEWRATAPPEQIEHFERAKVQRAEFRASFAEELKRAWSGPAIARQFYGSSPLLTMIDGHDDSAIAKAAATRRAEDRARHEETIAQFEKHGPAAVDFWRLRDARAALEAMDDA